MKTWKRIEGFKDWYEISDKGDLRYVFDMDCRNGVKIRKGESIGDYCTKEKYTYKRAGLTNFDTKERKSFNIHRLVAETFIPNPDNKLCVNHIDGDKYNNNVDNLEWCTHKENTAHAIDTKLLTHPTGEFRDDTRYDRGIILEILDMYYKGFMLPKEIESKLDIPKGYVPLIVKGLRWVAVYKDYVADSEAYFEKFRCVAKDRRAWNRTEIESHLKEMNNESMA